MELFFNLMTLLVPFVMVGLVIWAIVYTLVSTAKKEKERQAWLQAYATEHHYTFYPGATAMRVGGSYANGVISNPITGKLQLSGNTFWLYDQEETRGSGKNRQLFYRSVLLVETPDLLSQFIINSKLNNDQQTGGNLEAYKSSQKLQLEGNFSQYFDVLTPANDQTDLLTLLAPDVMQYIFDNFAAYDIELKDNALYIYSYEKLAPDRLVGLVPISDELTRRIRLRAQDARKSSLVSTSENAVALTTVARTAADAYERKSLVKSWVPVTGIIALVFIAWGIMSLLSPRDVFAGHSPIMPLAIGLTVSFFAVHAVKSLRAKRLRGRYEQAKKADGNTVDKPRD